MTLPKTPVASIPPSNYKNIKSIDSVESITTLQTPTDSKNSMTPIKKTSVNKKYMKNSNFSEINEIEGIFLIF